MAATTATNWSKIRNYKPGDFKHPEKLDESVVVGLDKLADRLSVRPEPIDDFGLRSDNPTSQHALGRAIDFVVPGVSPLEVYQAARGLEVFSGLGVYTNEKNVQSYHVDTRVDRTPHDPAVWGAWKDRDHGVVNWQYVGLADVFSLIKKKDWPALVLAGLIGLALFLILREN